MLSLALSIGRFILSGFVRLITVIGTQIAARFADSKPGVHPDNLAQRGNPRTGMAESSQITTSDSAPLVREGEIVRLRRHSPANRSAFQRWYADPEIANLLRHDLRPLNDRQSRGYFDSIILPLSAAGHCFAIHDRATNELIGTAALTETDDQAPRAMLFRIVIGEKAFWDRGFGTDATRLVVEEAFDALGLDEVRLEVFAHNPRAIYVYERVGFVRTGEHTEWLGPDRPRLHVFEMSIFRQQPDDVRRIGSPSSDPVEFDAVPDVV